MDKNITVVIVSRIDCFRCKEIEAVCIGDGVISQLLYWHEGGAKFLAKYKIMPKILPHTIVFKGKEILWSADGLSGFLEKWDTIK